MLEFEFTLWSKYLLPLTWMIRSLETSDDTDLNQETHRFEPSVIKQINPNNYVQKFLIETERTQNKTKQMKEDKKLKFEITLQTLWRRKCRGEIQAS